MWSLRNIFAVLLLVVAVVFAIIEYNGGFRASINKVSSAYQQKVGSSVQTPSDLEPKVSSNNSSSSSQISETSSRFADWIQNNKVSFGIIVVLVLCGLGIIFTKKFFDRL